MNIQTKEFSYEIYYKCLDNYIHIISNYESKKREFFIKKELTEKEEKCSVQKFYEKHADYLPAHVFTYYSGPSNRFEKLFSKHQRKFYEALLKPDEDKEKDEEKIRPLFYARLIHSNFVLLAFFSSFDENNQQFLRNYFDIGSVESILFVLHKANWVKNIKGNEYRKEEFWGARGEVRRFLDNLYQKALAPIKEYIKVNDGFKTINKEVIYLFIKDQKTLEEFTKNQNYKDNNVDFFKDLESIYLSDLLEEIRIKVKKTDGTIITFNELSEGEQQLLIVLGLLKFTKSKESLFLLDEPDTHLNPSWKLNYLKLIQEIAGLSDYNENSQVIISTHDPILIGGLKKEAVIIFEHGEKGTVVKHPAVDPKGMGVAGMLTSDLFELPSTLDPDTQAELDRKRQLQFKTNKSQQEIQELEQLEKEFENYGIGRTTRDPLYDKFIERLYSREEFQNRPIRDDERKEMTSLMDEILSELKNEENK